MLALLLAAVVAAPTTAKACQRNACVNECWEVRVTYHQVASGPGQPLAYQTAQRVVGGAWGDMENARCYADKVSREGFWLNTGDEAAERVPTPGPTKLPPAAVDLVEILEREF